MLDQLTAVSVHDRFRQPGRARGEQDVNRVVERDLLELERCALGCQLLPADGIRDLGVSERNPDHVLDRRDPPPDRLDLPAPVDVAVAVAVSADGQKHARLDLREAVDDAAGPELRGASGPDRADACGRDEADQRLGDIRHVRDHAIAFSDSEAQKPGPHPAGLLDQLAERELTRTARLRPGHDRDAVAILLEADQVLGVVETRAGEPLRAGHRRIGEHAVVRRRADPVELPQVAPEALEIVNRPAIQAFVLAELAAALVPQPVHETADLRRIPPVRGRRPQDVTDHRQRAEYWSR